MKVRILSWILLASSAGLQAGGFTSLTPSSLKSVFEANNGQAWNNLAMVERALLIKGDRWLQNLTWQQKKNRLANGLPLEVEDFQQKSDGVEVAWDWDKLTKYASKVFSKDLADEVLWRLRIKYWHVRWNWALDRLNEAREKQQKGEQEQESQKRQNAELQSQIDQARLQLDALNLELAPLNVQLANLRRQKADLQSRVNGFGQTDQNRQLAEERLITRDLDQKIQQYSPAREEEELQGINRQISEIKLALEDRPHSTLDQIRQENTLILNQQLMQAVNENLVLPVLERMAYFNRNQHEFDLSKVDLIKWKEWLPKVRAVNSTQLNKLVSTEPDSDRAALLFNIIRLRIKDFDLNQSLAPEFNLYDQQMVAQFEDQLDLWRALIASKEGN